MYTRVANVYNKLKKAEETYAPVLMTAASGYGKTAAWKYYYRRKNPLVIKASDGRLSESPKLSDIRRSVIVIEDMQWVQDAEDIRFIRSLLQLQGHQVILVTRGTVPGYLLSKGMDLVRIREEDFRFGEEEVRSFFQEREISVPEEDIRLITEASRGYAQALNLYASELEGGQRFSAEMVEHVWQDLFRLWDFESVGKWTSDFLEFAFALCPYPVFSLEMARHLTKNQNVISLIRYCTEKTNQLACIGEGEWSFRDEIRRFYLWKRDQLWSKERIAESFYRAAEFYEKTGDVPYALKYYSLANAKQKIMELLIRNAYTHPGTGHYVDTKEYYFSLTKDEIKDSPVLISGMSMLHDLLLMPQESEEWYEALVRFEKDKKNSREKRREARERIAYLDIALPHRGVKGILELVPSAFKMILNGEIHLPEFCATGNCPSIMNGGLDFSEWSKNDTRIAGLISKPLEAILGKYGKGLTTLALAESGFEKGTMESFEVLTRCSNGFEKAANGGRIEMCFASVGIQIRQYLLEGQLHSAKRVYHNFCMKAQKEDAKFLFPNLEAMGAYLSLFSGTTEEASSFAGKTPDVFVSFCISDRYRQMIKIRCLMAQERMDEALSTARFLTGYFTSYERFFYEMENEVLMGIILYRMGHPNWKDFLHSALEKAEPYHFTRIFALEGAALLPLFKEQKEGGALNGFSEDFIEQISTECQAVAASYPDYLQYIKQENVVLTKRERDVLALLCKGLSSQAICEALDISYNGLKKHNRNIYQKLNAKNRAEAERRALQLGLVHRGS